MALIGKEYLEHPVFPQLKKYSEFYKDLSFDIMHWLNTGTSAVVNIDTYVFSSIQGTLDSIYEILMKGRINDAYSLLRKYYDSTIINIYTNLYLEDNFNFESYFVTQINNWIKGKDKLPEYRVMSQYIRDSAKLKPISTLLHQENLYKTIRERCNDHTHYNYYRHILYNDGELYLDSRIKLLDSLLHDLDCIFIQHFAYLFYLKDNYMMSSDYIDSLDVGLIPEEDSQYLVASFIQEMFDSIIKAKRPDIAAAIKEKTAMKLT